MWSAVCTWRWNRILCKYPNQIHIWSSTVLSKSFTFWKSREPKPAASLSSCGRRAWDSQPERCHPFLIYFHFSTKKKKGAAPPPKLRNRPYLHPQPYPVRASGGVCRGLGLVLSPPVYCLLCTRKIWHNVDQTNEFCRLHILKPKSLRA